MNEENKEILQGENKQDKAENIEQNKVQEVQNKEENKIQNEQDRQENTVLSVSENSTSSENVSKNEDENVLNYNLEEFNTLVTTEGNLKFNEQMYLEMKTTNLYLNLILLSVVTCFLYYVVSKALKKLFYINI